MKRFILLLSLALILISPTMAARHVINIQGLTFNPASQTASPGDTIVWKNLAAFIHTSTSGSGCAPDGHWNSGNIPAGDSFKIVLSMTGVYPYYCIPHCDIGMTGTITVNPLGVQDTMAAVPAPGSRLKNSPNPFTPYTLVDYQVEKPGNTSVKIYDGTGRLVKVLIEGYKAPGNYSLLWDGRNTRGESVQSGVYFYQLITGRTVINKKMIRLK